jgi:hypothetical protein
LIFCIWILSRILGDNYIGVNLADETGHENRGVCGGGCINIVVMEQDLFFIVCGEEAW